MKLGRRQERHLLSSIPLRMQRRLWKGTSVPLDTGKSITLLLLNVKLAVSHCSALYCRYIEVFRSTHAEIRPVMDRTTWRGGHRSSPYPSRGGRFGGPPPGPRYASGYERQYRGGGAMRGRGRGDPYADSYGQYYGDGSYQGGPAPVYQGLPPEQSGTCFHSAFIYFVSTVLFLLSPTPGAGRHTVRLRGLPYSAEDRDIINFFSPLVIVRIDIERDSIGRPSGGAEVEFQTHEDALEAMKRDRQHIGMT